MPTVSAADANRRFSSVLRDVTAGETFTVLSRGKPVATIAPYGHDTIRRQPARRRLVDRLRGQASTGERAWTRDELYER